MSKFVLISLLSLSLAATVLEGRAIQLENNQVVYMRSVDSSELAQIEAVMGCSTRCAAACLAFSTGQAAVQCAKHCGCSSLIDTKPQTLQKTSLYEADVTVEVYFPQSNTGTTEIFADVMDEEVRVSIQDTQDSSTGDVSVTATVNTESGSSSQDEVVVYGYAHSDQNSEEVAVAAVDPSGNTAFAGAATSESETNTTYSSSSVAYAGSVDSNGNASVSYVEQNYTQVTDGNTTVYVQNTSSYVGGETYEEVEVGVYTYNSTDGSAQGASIGYWEWTSASQVVSGILESIVPFVFAAVLLVFFYFAYRKISEENVKFYKTSVTPVDSSADYIRI